MCGIRGTLKIFNFLIINTFVFNKLKYNVIEFFSQIRHSIVYKKYFSYMNFRISRKVYRIGTNLQKTVQINAKLSKEKCYIFQASIKLILKFKNDRVLFS